MFFWGGVGRGKEITIFLTLRFKTVFDQGDNLLVWPHFQTPRPRSSNILGRGSHFSTLFSMLVNVVKHVLSCLIYYFKVNFS